MAHWSKGGHKFECFPPSEQQRKFYMLLCRLGPSFDEAAAMEAANEALRRKLGCVVYLGTTFLNSDGVSPRHKIITDEWTGVNDKEDTCPPSLPPELYLPHVPPAFLCKAEDDFGETPVTQHDPAKIIHCTQLLDEPIFDDVGSHHFKIALKSLFTITEEHERKAAIELVQKGVQVAAWTQQIPLPRNSPMQEHAETVIGEVLRVNGGIEMVYITPPVICFADLNKSELAFLNEDNRHPDKPLTHNYPILRSPVAAYRCVEEGWVLIG